MRIFGHSGGAAPRAHALEEAAAGADEDWEMIPWIL